MCLISLCIGDDDTAEYMSTISLSFLFFIFIFHFLLFFFHYLFSVFPLVFAVIGDDDTAEYMSSGADVVLLKPVTKALLKESLTFKA